MYDFMYVQAKNGDDDDDDDDDFHTNHQYVPSKHLVGQFSIVGQQVEAVDIMKATASVAAHCHFLIEISIHGFEMNTARFGVFSKEVVYMNMLV